jgi:hypothetical protein
MQNGFKSKTMQQSKPFYVERKSEMVISFTVIMFGGGAGIRPHKNSQMEVKLNLYLINK